MGRIMQTYAVLEGLVRFHHGLAQQGDIFDLQFLRLQSSQKKGQCLHEKSLFFEEELLKFFVCALFSLLANN